MKIARRVTEVAPSLTLQITSLARKLKEQGEKIVNFAAGEPDTDTPNYIKEAAIDAIKQGFTKYTPVAGWPQLKEVISKKFKQDNRLNYSPEQIVVSCGAKHALYNILQVLCEEEDEVIIGSPYWISYPEMVRLSGATVRLAQTHPQNQFKLDKESLVSSITKKTKALILNSPANPTGSVYSRDELEEISALAIKRDFYVISDEIYEKLIFDGKKHLSCASLNEEIYKRTIVVNGVSKSYSMTGWRIGYLASPDEQIIQAIKKLQSHSTSNPCSISQKAAYHALEETEKDQIQKMLEGFQARRNCMLDGLNKISELSYIKPEGAFYVFCNISQLRLDSITFCRKLLEEAAIAAIPGKAFGRDDYIRLSFATNRNEIEEGLHRLKDWIKNRIRS